MYLGPSLVPLWITEVAAQLGTQALGPAPAFTSSVISVKILNNLCVRQVPYLSTGPRWGLDELTCTNHGGEDLALGSAAPSSSDQKDATQIPSPWGPAVRAVLAGGVMDSSGLCTHTQLFPHYLLHTSLGEECGFMGWMMKRIQPWCGKDDRSGLNGSLGLGSLWNPPRQLNISSHIRGISINFIQYTLWKMGQTHQRLRPENHQKAKISLSSDASFRGLFTQALTKYNNDWNVTEGRQSWQQGEPLKFITGTTEKVFKPWSLVSWVSGWKIVQGGIHNITYFYTSNRYKTLKWRQKPVHVIQALGWYQGYSALSRRKKKTSMDFTIWQQIRS